MYKTTLFLSLLLMGTALSAQSEKLLGVCSRENFLQPPHQQWYTQQYQDYQPDTSIVGQLKKLSLHGYEIEIFFGTWCGDSRREVPRFLKVLDSAGFDPTTLKVIAVDNENYKQSPGGETLGKGIFKVPTFIVLKNGKEINRIVEYPVESLEADLLEILTRNDYTPHYANYLVINHYYSTGLLNDKHLAELTRDLTSRPETPAMLNTAARVFLAQNKLPEAITLLLLNNHFFPENIDTYLSLANALYENQQPVEALKYAEQAIRTNKDNRKWDEMLDLYYSIRKSQE